MKTDLFDAGEVETVTRTVAIVDADGVLIRVGSVLREISDRTQGVVTKIARAGDRGFGFPLMTTVGDLIITTSCSSCRVTNRYSQWRHVPRAEQTYEQRYTSWTHQKYEHDAEYSKNSPDEGRAISGVMALLPEDVEDWDYEPYPDSIEAALGILAAYMTRLEHERKPTCPPSQS